MKRPTRRMKPCLLRSRLLRIIACIPTRVWQYSIGPTSSLVLFEEACRRNAIKYSIVGGFSFYERAEIKDLLCYLKVCLNPQDSISVLRIVNTPPRGNRKDDHRHSGAGGPQAGTVVVGTRSGWLSSRRRSQPERSMH